ncbi:hypothetical protein C8D77_11189 [Mesorhizobium loti]|uniref:Uncharacterized protein n=1 Tax=Rhizobium loti TaxID=381 RepID=A0A8E2W843_RHILI|nr:hypothetical protein [Mesorhizobium loti]PWJ88367.1 hypothetical protein C8D77_11189 [Mesorhizobium loti]
MRTIKKGATSQSIYVDVLDSASTTGGRKTGLAYNTSSLTAYYVRNQNTAVAITLATLAAANTAWSSGGFKEVDSANMPGIYRLDVPDAAFATGAESVAIVIKGAAGMVQASVDVQLVDNLASDVFARIGAPVGASISADIAGVQADTDNIQTRIPAALVSGRIDASVGAMAAAVLTAAAIAADAITDAKVASDVTIASVTGTVGSVTGAVGSVAGNVGGNVTGSVGSVTGITASDVGAIKAKTDNLPSDPADESLIIAATDAIMGRLGAPSGASVSADVAAVKSDTGAVKAKTDNLPSDPADASDIASAFTALQSHGDSTWATATGFATAASLATTDGKVDSIKAWQDAIAQTAGKLWVLNENGDALPKVDDIKAGVWSATIADYLGGGKAAEILFDGTAAAQSADGKADTIIADIAALPDAPTASEVAVAVWDEALAGHATDGTAGKVLTDTGAAAGTIEGRIGTPNFGDLADDIAHAQGSIDGIGTAVAALNDLSSADVDQSITDAALATAADISAISIPSPSDNADALLAATYEGAETVQDHFRLARAALYGKANGLAGTTVHFRDAADSKNRLTATVDSDGNRSAVATDAT